MKIFEKICQIYATKKHRLFEIITVLSLIFAILSLGYAIHVNSESSKDLADLNEKLILTQNDLNKTTIKLDSITNQLIEKEKEFQNFIRANTNEILLAIYEVNSIGLGNESRESYFTTKFGISYDKALNLLEYSSKTDDSEMGFSSLMYGDYSTSLYHFEMALIKDPLNTNLKIGKSGALIGLNKPIEARDILFDFETDNQDKKIINKLMGDTYYIEENYPKAIDYYITALGYYFTDSGKIDIASLDLFMQVCEIEANGLYDSPDISITELNNGWKVGSVILKDFGIVMDAKYMIEY